ncbi:LysR substrate-binding domain-containing protein [Aquamicrobium sp. LC103]|uniref:LysR substrate-binding domain-containing protein n=1 Tax=Aquamicrobium sp. LC103 TaxID=1120658 RepID=UPI00063E9307|nr:LysR substrate-binding domain-containing protein [Aquamicrobium sp. LC103]TKT77357.1 LysR family transcriptional regulator [Aquamicrobium sp. LC103]
MKELNRVHLNGLRALEAVGRLGTLQRAAEELGVSPGAVSQQIVKCEKQLGQLVFDRVGRGLVPTAFGRGFLARLSTGFRELDNAVASSRHHAEEVLTLSVAPVFASKWLVPRLARYSRLHPDIRVRLDASTNLIDPDASDVDLAIRVGDGNWPEARVEFLLPQEVFPVCAPELARQIREPRDILKLPIVRDANSTLSWNTWLKQFGLDESQLGDGYSFTDAALCLDAAVAGQGVMLAWQTLAHYALSVGQLVAPFPERAATGLGYWLVTSSSKREPRKVTNFKRWLKSEIEETAKDFTPL